MLVNTIKDLINTDYAEQFQPISTISLDDANNEVLCDSDMKCWNFDGIIQTYAKEKGVDAVSSPDMLHFDRNRLVFVEFKNGIYDSKTRKGTRAKIIEGPFIGLKELLESKNISFDIKELKEIERVYIVVYNQEKSQKMHTASKFHQGMGHLRNRSILERYEGVFINKVHLFSPERFLKLLVSKWIKEE